MVQPTFRSRSAPPSEFNVPSQCWYLFLFFFCPLSNDECESTTLRIIIAEIFSQTKPFARKISLWISWLHSYSRLHVFNLLRSTGETKLLWKRNWSYGETLMSALQANAGRRWTLKNRGANKIEMVTRRLSVGSGDPVRPVPLAPPSLFFFSF